MDHPSPSSLYNNLSVLFDDYQLFHSSNSDSNMAQYHYQPSTQTEATSIHEGTNLNLLETHDYDRVIQNSFFSPSPLPMSNEESYHAYELQHIANKDIPCHQSSQLEKLNQESGTSNRNTIEAPALVCVSQVTYCSNLNLLVGWLHLLSLTKRRLLCQP